MVLPANSQSTNQSAKLHQTSNNFSLLPERYLCIRIPLEKNQSINGSYTISNFHYYPNKYIGGYGEPITYMTEVDLYTPNNELLYNFSNPKEGEFNFTALETGDYILSAFCSYIWGVDNPIVPILTLNYATKNSLSNVSVSPSPTVPEFPITAVLSLLIAL